MYDSPPDFWTPDGVEYIQSWEPIPGFITEDGQRVIKHEFKLVYKGETEFFGVLGEDDTSDDQVEDMAAATAERAAVKIFERLQARGSKLVPEALAGETHKQVRRELAAVFRDYMKSSKRRAASSTGKIYYAGIQT